MDGVSYWAWIPGIILFLVVFARYIWPLIVRAVVKSAEKKGNICDACKGKMLEVREHLRLLPVHFDQSHVCSADYYIHSTMPIQDITEAPTGNRVCRIFLLQCQTCGRKEVVVIDFLPVRGQEIIKNADVFSYEEFREFYES